MPKLFPSLVPANWPQPCRAPVAPKTKTHAGNKADAAFVADMIPIGRMP